jgi:hypothetical protein
MQIAAFYWRWITTAFGGLMDRVALVAFVVITAIDTVEHFRPFMRERLHPIVWEVPFWALLTLVSFRLLAAPYRIWAADQATIRGLRVGADRKAVRETLASLLKEGAALEVQCRTNSNSQWVALNEWFGRAVEYLGGSLDQSYVQRFGSDAGFTASFPIGPYNETQRNQLTWLNHRSQRLQEFIRELV